MDMLILAGVFYFLYFITKLILTFNVHKDAKSLQLKAGIWSMIVMLLPNYIGLVFYLIIRTLTINKTLNETEKNIHMKNFKKHTLLIISILCLGASYCFLGKFFNDTFSSKFDNYQDAKSIIEQGWVPSHIPNTSTDIYEVHNLDTNIGNGTFKLSKNETKKFASTLNSIEKNKVLKMQSIQKKWWNEDEIKNNVKNDKLLLGEKDNFIYAVDPNGTVYFWVK